MGSNVVLGLVIGGAAVGVGFLVWRSRQAKQETKPPGSKEACEAAAKAAGLPTAVCDVGLPIVEDIVGGVTDFVENLGNVGGEYRAKDEANRKLNGEIETPLLKSVTSCVDGAFSPRPADYGGYLAHLWGSAVKFKNGCVPFAGAPGWEKCAPGTNNMFLPGPPVGIGDSPDPFTGQKNVDLVAASELTGTGARYFTDGKIKTDPLTGRFMHWGSANDGCAFPIPIPDGHRPYFVKGKPVTCPEGMGPDLVRGGCKAIPTPSGPALDENGEMGSGSFKDLIGTTKGPRSSTTIDCGSDPNFVLDPGPPPYCRRKRAGEP